MNGVQLLCLFCVLSVTWARPQFSTWSHDMINYINKANSTWTVREKWWWWWWRSAVCHTCRGSLSLSLPLFYFSFSLSVFTGWCEFSGCGVQFSEVSLWNSTEGTETAVYVSNISESSEYINSSWTLKFITLFENSIRCHIRTFFV